MLSELYIENIAVIEKAGIQFRKGLNILTGETGAGKSIVIDSIHAVLGERTSRDLVRTGAKSAFVSASFDELPDTVLEKAREYGFEPEDGGLLLQRTISAEGKSSCRVNGRPTSVSVLRDLGRLLLSIHGQHDTYELLSPELHLAYVDRMGETELLLEDYRKEYREMEHCRKEWEKLQMDETNKARRIDLLQYQIQELEAAQLHPGEQEELAARKTLYGNSEKVSASLGEARACLEGGEEDGGAVSEVQSAAAALQEAARFLPTLSETAERLQTLSYDLQDCQEMLRDASSQLDYDPAQLEEIEERLDLLYRLGLKYGGTEEAMLEYLEKCQAELETITLSEEHAARFAEAYQKARKKAKQHAAVLSEKRREAGKVLAGRVQEELKLLDMPNVRFEVEQTSCELSPDGADKLQFLVSTNPGEPPKPIAKIASGGELSRIMLALKTVLSNQDIVGTMIFDEVDAGIGGSAAGKVGKKLKEVSRSRQVICVTHSAQIAAMAETQFRIEKKVLENRTFTDVHLLSHEERQKEIARMIGGTDVTELTMRNAEEMLCLAQNS
ncbi:DNA repair protein RecN [Anaeromassilibacillus sp. An200]|uniref:DNA repair protein RecN n=1 Tax=Candidatus Caccousia stercoris TaxID=2840723 RepID=A0A9D1FRP9_9FIRM|nr:DNA repair protein RecN [Anaeromassilibacillus sp. An200]OUP08754.1 DNA repair protein RecN [Anaeromassilibacillus sp. An200]HIS78619.1 DNA repair protein RecN [Candidatus Caccousia stercoris]